MASEVISSTKAKSEFVKSIYNWLMNTLKTNGNLEEYGHCFKIEGSSIMCELPSNFFNFGINHFTIPENTKIEMKFISKK